MSETQDGLLHENYSATEDFKYEIYANPEQAFDVFLFAYDQKMGGYFLMHKDRLTAPTLAQAIALGDAELTQLNA